MSVRNGFSTLNRLLGKKNKDKSISKSSTNLSLSSNHIDTTLSSHLQTQNRITPLPVATSNAPFEQTFRITVLLPRDQLYVARLGAKIKLEKLLELVCENKQLDPEHYEFRHSTDSSQVFSLELTIGSVGLTEIRLCHKSETYDNFNADEIIKLRHQTVGRDSLSSSEFSSRNSKHTKTASPYSSTNSLNSIDSTGMNTNYRAPLSLPSPTSIQPTTTTTQSITSKLPPVAPVRKKRMAPRPPNQQNSIVEKTNGIKENQEEHHIFQTPLPRKEFHESTPNLSTFKGLTILENSEFHQSNQSIDLNGNINKSQINNVHLTNGKLNGKENLPDENHIKSFAKFSAKKRPMSMHIINQDINIATTPEENENRLSGNLNLTYGSVQSLNTEHLNGSIEGRLRLPEPSPRKKIVVAKKKTVAPAPPPRNLTMPPVATPRITTTSIINESNQAESEEEAIDLSATSQQNEQLTTNNISKVMLNQSEIDGGTSELSVPFSPKSPPSDFKNLPTPITNDEEFFTPPICKNHDIDFTNSEDRQTDSGIGEPIPATDSLPPSEASHCDESLKSNFETSSDDDEHVKVYNLKLGKTIIQPVLLEEHKTLENLTELSAGDNTTNVSVVTNNTDTNSIRSNSPNWTYTIPAPPNFADMDEPTSSVKSESSSTESACCDDDIIKIEEKKFIKERSPVNFQVCKADVHYSETQIPENNKDSMIIKECEIFKKCKPVRKDEEIYKNDQLNIDNTETDIAIINSDVEDGYYGNKNNCNGSSVVEEYLNKENLRKDNNIIENHETQDENINKCSTDIKITKSEVLNELNNVISENCIDKIIKKSDENEDIESVGPCNLSNFKITTYNPSICPVKIFEEPNNTQRNDEIFKELDDIRLQEDDEKLYRKRTSITATPNIPVQFLKTRRSITRSDSFHSTALQQNPDKSSESFNNLQNSRSSSFLSLLAAQKQENSMTQTPSTTTTNLTSKFLDTNRCKSSSELSIGESPSLQSLIIMKSILNGRKNSLNNDTETDKVISIYGNQNKSASTTNNGKILEELCNGIAPKNNNNNNSKVLSQDIFNVEQNITNNTNINNDNDDGTEKSDDQPEKKWKYQGPPSINLSTWNERPKIQSVTIKNEGDYIIGGNNNNNNTKVTTSISPLPRNVRCSLPSTITTSFTSNQQYSNTNSNNSITPINSSQSIILKQQPKIPFVRSVEYKKMNSPTTINNINEKSNSDDIISNPKSLSAGTTMTLGRIPKINNRQLNNQMPIVKGFQSLDNCGDIVVIEQFKLQPPSTLNNDISTNTLEKTSTNLKSNLNNNNYRYSYAGASNIDDQIILNRKIEKDNQIIPAFAQIQLRKTGLKDKICPNNDNSMNIRKTLPAKRLEQLELEQENCTKLEIKLTEQKINNSSIPIVSTVPSTVPSPPPPPIIRSVVTKQNSNGLSAPSTIDPRDQLLSAIRDFNKNELRQS